MHVFCTCMQLIYAPETRIVYAEYRMTYLRVSQRLAECASCNMLRIALPCILPRRFVTIAMPFTVRSAPTSRVHARYGMTSWFRSERELSLTCNKPAGQATAESGQH